MKFFIRSKICLFLFALASLVVAPAPTMSALSSASSSGQEPFLNIVELDCLQQNDGCRCGYFTAFHTEIFHRLQGQVARCSTQDKVKTILASALCQPREADFEAWVERMDVEEEVVIDIDADESRAAPSKAEQERLAAKKQLKQSYNTPDTEHGQGHMWLGQYTLEPLFPSALTVDEDIQLRSTDYVAYTLMLKSAWVNALYQFSRNKPILIMLNTQTNHWIAALLHPQSKTLFIADSIREYPRHHNLLPGIMKFFSYAQKFTENKITLENLGELNRAIKRNPADAHKLLKGVIPEGYIQFFKAYKEARGPKRTTSSSSAAAALPQVVHNSSSESESEGEDESESDSEEEDEDDSKKLATPIPIEPARSRSAVPDKLNKVELPCPQMRDRAGNWNIALFYAVLFANNKDGLEEAQTEEDATDILTRLITGVTQADVTRWNAANAEIEFPSILTYNPDLEITSLSEAQEMLEGDELWTTAREQFTANDEPIIILINTQRDHWITGVMHPQSRTFFVADAHKVNARNPLIAASIVKFFSPDLKNRAVKRANDGSDRNTRAKKNRKTTLQKK